MNQSLTGGDPLDRRGLTLLKLLNYRNTLVVLQSGASSLTEDLWSSSDTQTDKC